MSLWHLGLRRAEYQVGRQLDQIADDVFEEAVPSTLGSSVPSLLGLVPWAVVIHFFFLKENPLPVHAGWHVVLFLSFTILCWKSDLATVGC